MATATAIGTVAAVGLSTYQTVQGAKQARESKQAIENYRRQTLENVYDGMEVSTLGSDLRSREATRATATSVDALRASGQRGLQAGLGRTMAANNQVNREIAADLDRRQERINQLKARGESEVQRMTETREREDLAGLGTAMNVGRHNAMRGAQSLTSSVMTAGRMYDSGAYDGAFGTEVEPEFNPYPNPYQSGMMGMYGVGNNYGSLGATNYSGETV